ncbi:insecticidal delta-endotoxin Cry8Ea1 family protein, partial [Lysinibacillus sp. UGB7]|uniref:insecticidal delta-endotoxin Cry8Ea1 family protein n=1 Tax=Lysinibacillus sp. UGB7 TaxID=3411039 RepID=UPI003B7CE074
MKREKEGDFEIQEDSIILSKMKNKYSIHPLEKSPTAAIQTMNYKDWLNMCEGNSRNDLMYLEPFVYSFEGLIAGTAATIGTIVAISNPILGAGVAIVSILIPLLWPEGKPLWESIIEYTEKLVQRELSEFARIKALSELAGLKKQLDAFNRAFEDWKMYPSINTANEVKNRFQNTNNSFINAMPGFALAGYEEILLPIYAQAANLHLLFLRTGLIYADEWGLSRADGNLHYNELLLYTAEYTNYCTTEYNKGLKNIFKGPWSIYNTYRTFMTINVLDIIALFPNYDPRLYPISTNIELTREIYSEGIFPLTSESAPPILTETVENSLTRQPHLFTWLQKLELFYSTPGLFDSALTGHRSLYSNTDSTISSSITVGPMFGNSTDKNQKDFDFATGYIFRVTTTTTLGTIILPSIRGIAFEYTNYYPTYQIPPSEDKKVFVQELNTNSTNLDITRNTFTFPPLTRETLYENVDNYSHILSYFTSHSEVPSGPPIAFTFAWTHKSVSRISAIGSEGFNRITQIPAIKATDMNHLSVAIKGPGFTGGDLIQLKTHGLANYSCKPLTNELMKVRIRYASASSSTYLEIGGARLQLEKTINNPDDDLIYENFKYAYLPEYVEPGNFFIEHRGTSSSESDLVLLDKIEFIPYDFYTKEMGMENLDIVKKAVNTLFTDDSKNDLKADTTDYQIDQVANLVECVSDDLYAKEKIILLDEVKYAKQLSQSRNLLQNGDFENPNGNGF